MSNPHRKSDGASKYMVAVEEFKFLSNFIEYINKEESTLQGFVKELLGKVKAELQETIKSHFETSASTRQKFVSMPPEQWKDRNGLFRLNEVPRPILGYLPKKTLETLDDQCKAAFVGMIENDRASIEASLDEMRASDSDRAEVANLLARDLFFLQDVEEHRKTALFWKDIASKKVSILNELEAREIFLEEIEQFEERASGDPTRYAKGNSLKLAEENKYRANATKKLRDLDASAIKRCSDYKTQTGRDFQVDGVNYLEMIKEQQFGRSSTGLSLAKLRTGAIPASQKQKYAGGAESNLVADVNQSDLDRRLSLHDQIDPNHLIREGKKKKVPQN
jgi:hypothetical protein